MESRGLGNTQAREVAIRLEARTGPQTPWFKALGATQDVHEEREVARAIAEWSDGDSIAAHYGYANDFFCSADIGKSAKNSVLSPGNRTWLTTVFGIRFVTLSELAGIIEEART
jgi:hypothetical protein